MAASAGKTGKFLYGAGDTFVDLVSGWKMNPKSGEEDITDMQTGNDAQWKTWVATLAEADGSVELSAVDLGDTGQKAMWDALGGAAVAAKFYINGSHYLSASIIINSFPIDAAVGGVVGKGASVGFRVSGAVSYT